MTNSPDAQNELTGDLFRVWRNRDEHLGFGYIGERAMTLDGVESDEKNADLLDAIAAADEFILEHARRAGWDAERLFQWANSKNGRWFADEAFYTNSNALARASQYLH